MKKIILVIVAFCLLSIGLTWIWNESLRESYAIFINTVAPPIYDFIGFGGSPMRGMRLRYINIIPFVSLVLVTPGISLRRRGLGLGLGLFAIFVSHLALNLTALNARAESLPVVAALVSDTIPIVLWFIIAYPVLKRFMPGTVEG